MNDVTRRRKLMLVMSAGCLTTDY